MLVVLIFSFTEQGWSQEPPYLVQGLCAQHGQSSQGGYYCKTSFGVSFPLFW